MGPEIFVNSLDDEDVRDALTEFVDCFVYESLSQSDRRLVWIPTGTTNYMCVLVP
jgi:hypothetical protein